MASVVPLKGASHEFPARRLVACFKELGLEAHDLVLKSDREPASCRSHCIWLEGEGSLQRHSTRCQPWEIRHLMVLQIEVCRLWSGTFRVLKDALEARLGAEQSQYLGMVG